MPLSLRAAERFSAGGPRHQFALESVESRRLLSAVYPTVYEQYMVELYNRARANPAAALAPYGIDVNEGLAAGTLSTAPKQPLAINPNLTDAARSYAQWVIDADAQLSHIGPDGTYWVSRMVNAGYVLNTPSGTGENAGLTYAGWINDYTTAISNQFADFLTDLSLYDRYHRVNIMNASYKEVGSGLGIGPYFGATGMTTIQDFAYSGTGSFLTGVAYADSSGDNFYTPGEQLGGINITALSYSDGTQYTTTTWSSGGYSLPLPNGSYSVWASGPGLNGWVRYDNVTINGENVKRDFRPDLIRPGDLGPPTFAMLSGGILAIDGTANDDSISVSISDRAYVSLNGATLNFDPALVSQIVISGSDGNDYINTSQAGTIPETIYGDAGNDTLIGGAGSDLIYGYLGNDRIYGGSGNDVLFGEKGNDSLFGQDGNDILDGDTGADLMMGGLGNDTADYSSRSGNLNITLGDRFGAANDGEAGENDNVLDDVETVLGGAGNDILAGSPSNNYIYGGAGNDTITGGTGNDSIFGADGNDCMYGDEGSDFLNGGAGIDEAHYDSLDLLANCEGWFPMIPGQLIIRATAGRQAFRPIAVL
ncbi:MAG TPA: carboxypeptidase regulatory-like domain-containing protein [Tepidisphaeraceae bacterium]|nr:carboxypeptidase regulatory-like domain-containing protein [Tepidisphaeraceae bacterium]